MKVVILGAGGFLGSNILKNLLIKGFDVVPVLRQDLDLTNFNNVSRFLHATKPDIVINCVIPGGRNKIDNLDQSDFDEHLKIFLNFYNLSHYFKKFFSIGSGAEFDRSTEIFDAHETNILTCDPIDIYGKLKNTTARISMQDPKFYTLRIFGCFDKTESANRLFSKIQNSNEITIDDRCFDFISVKDFCTVLRHFINTDTIYRDVNCVYNDKRKLSDIANLFIKTHDLHTRIIINTTQNLSYSGNGGRLEIMNLPLDGLVKSIKEYNE
jgi:dTDP-4-dehydrorhamnose reductase